MNCAGDQADGMNMNLLENSKLNWQRFTGGEEFDYPIDYSAVLLNVRDDGHVDLLYRWEPNRYCHFHRHTAHTTSTVLSGELHVIDVDIETGKETGRRVRHAGDYAHKAPGDVHMERAGPDGALVLFNLYAPDGIFAETLATDGTVLGVATLDFILGWGSSRAGNRR
jgi:hypothetical protein